MVYRVSTVAHSGVSSQRQTESAGGSNRLGSLSEIPKTGGMADFSDAEREIRTEKRVYDVCRLFEYVCV